MKEMMKDFVLQNLNVMSAAETAQCIREGVVTLSEIEKHLQTELSKDSKDVILFQKKGRIYRRKM